MKKSRYGKLSILIILIATLFISAAIALFGLSTNDLTGANSSAEITAPEKDASSAIVGGNSDGDGTIENPEVEATATASYTGIANWNTAVATSGNTLTLQTCTLTQLYSVPTGITLNLVIPSGVTVTMGSNYIYTYGTLNVTGSGTIVAGTSGALRCYNVLSFNGPTIRGGTYMYGAAIYVNGGTTTMSGGTITGASIGSSGWGPVYVATGTFNMTGGSITQNTADFGGAVGLNNDSTFNMSGGTIANNTATSEGGAVYLQSTAKFIMTNSATITANNAAYGAAIRGRTGTTVDLRGGTISRHSSAASQWGAVYMSGATLKISGCKITGNTGGFGGAIGINGGTFTMTSGSIYSNKALSFGGAVYLQDSAKFTMSGGTIGGSSVAMTNSAPSGGGVYVSSGCEFTLSGGTINNNVSSGSGAGVYVSASKFTMTSGIIDHNAATKWAGAVYAQGAATTRISGGTISNNSGTHGGAIFYNGTAGTHTISGGTFSGNRASVSGGAIYMYANLTLSGGTITGNTATSNGGGICVENGTLTMNNANALIIKNTAVNGGGVATVSSGVFHMSAGTIGGGSTANKNTATGSGGGVYQGSTGASTFTGGGISYNTAKNGGGIAVASGSFTEGIAIASGSTANGVTYYNTASENGGGVYISGGTYVLNGNGTALRNNTAKNGGGVYITGGTFNMGLSWIHSNTATANGGGVYYNGGTFKMQANSCIGYISSSGGGGNTAANGGGLYLNASYTFSAGKVTNNKATSNGGGVFVNAGTFTINNANALINSNKATSHGGGVFLTNSTKIAMSAGTIATNSSTHGAGVAVMGSAQFALTGGNIGGSTANKNKASEYGGGVLIQTTGTCTMSTGVSYNQAKNGGGVCVYSGTLTHTLGGISYNTATVNGGGVFVNSGATYTINGGTSPGATAVLGCTAANVGGGVFIAGGTFNLTSGYIGGASDNAYANKAPLGGGVYMDAGTMTIGANGYVSRNQATSATATTATNGGGIFVSGGTLNMNGGAIQYNTATNTGSNTSMTNGGGVYMSGGAFNMNAGAIRGNSVRTNGGGVYVGGTATFKMTGGTIGGSGAGNTAGGGAGLFLASTTAATFSGGTISYNTAASGWGGGIYAYTGSTLNMSGTAIVAYNTAVYGGGIIAASSTATTAAVKVNISGGQIYANKNVTTTNDVGGGGIFVYHNSTVTMSGGTIGGPNASYANTSGRGAGVAVSSNGTFTMNGANAAIKYNSATSGYGSGGGVTIFSGTFNFSAGTIANNTAINGGGVHYSTGTFTMTGGTIGGSAAAANTATRDGGGVYMSSGTFTPTGGAISYNKAATSGVNGGGAVAVAGGTFTLNNNNVIITNNSASYGGGVYVVGGKFVMSDGAITSNSATHGGAVAVRAGSFEMSGGVIGGEGNGNTAQSHGAVLIDGTGTGTMSAGTISYNTAHFGGGLCVFSGTFTQTGGEIVHNKGVSGGGVNVQADGTYTLNDGTISDNTASDVAGGVHNGGTFIMAGGEIVNNKATSNGGAVFTGKTFKMTGGVISGNTSTNKGGGVYLGGGTFEMTAGRITENSATTPYGNGVWVRDGEFKLGGTAYIYGNTYREFENNVYVDVEGAITFSANLSDGAKIGISGCITQEDFVLTDGFTTAGHSEADIAKYFVSDNRGLTLNYINEEIVLRFDVALAWNETVQASLNNGTQELFVLYFDWTVKNSSFGEGIGFTNDGTILVPVSADILFDGNGFTLDRSGTSGSVMRVEGTLVFDSRVTSTIKGGNAENGGGVYVAGGIFTIKKNTVITENTASYGGGVYIDGNGEFVLRDSDSQITLNEAENGGGVFISDGTFVFESGIIGAEDSGNTAQSYGGGVYVDNSGNFEMNGGIISYNTALNGAGVYVRGGRITLDFTFDNENLLNSINNNTASGNGGGLYVESGNVDFVNGGILLNTAENGGGVYIAGGAVTMDGSDSIAIGYNTATNSGGGVYMSGGRLVMQSGLVASNEAVNGAGIYMTGAATQLTVAGGTIGGSFNGDSVPNVASGKGASVYVDGGTFTLTGDGVISTNIPQEDSDAVGNVYLAGGTFNMTGGEISGSTFANGGALYMTGGNFKITDGSIKNNTATEDGGALYMTGGTAAVAGGEITDNTANRGGAAYIAGGTMTVSAGLIGRNQSNGAGGVFVADGATLRMTGGTIGGSEANKNTSTYDGGGVVAVAGGIFEMSGGEISYNTANRGGGIWTAGTFEMSGGEISHNTATHGGGVANMGTARIISGKINNNTAENGGGVYLFEEGKYTMSGGEISGNEAGYGGGVYNLSGTFELNGGSISGNTATNNGGGVYNNDKFIVSDGEIVTNTAANGGGVYSIGEFTLSGGKLSNNTATLGGGVYNIGNGTFAMTDGNIVENTAGSGAGVYVNASTVEISGGNISENRATDATETAGGGGLFVVNGNLTVSGTAKITKNTSARYGGGLRIDGSTDTSTVEISGGSISENGATIGGGAYLTGSFAHLSLNGSVMVSENTATTSGGAVAIYGGAKVEVSGDAFLTYNTASANGGAAYVTGAGSALTVSEKGALTHNSANYGGAVYVTASGAFTMADGSLAYNEASTSGGAVYVNGGTFNLEDGEIIGNSAVEYGGAIYVAAGSTSVFTMSGGAIGGEDTFTNTSARGGGMYVAGGAVTISSGSISGNTATVNGGGVYLNAGTFSVKGNPIISGNKLNDSDSNLYLYNGKTIKIVGKLTDGASIGLTGKDKITEDYTTNGNGETEKAYFFGDVLGTVVAIVNGEIYLQVSLKDAWNAAVQASLDNNGNPITFVLAEAWRAENGSFGEGVGFTDDGALYLPSGAYIVLNLNNYSIDRNLSTITATGSVFYVKGTLEISGTTGIITGGKSEQGGGVHIEEGGLFKMEVAYIQQNEATQGGGVYVESGARFELAEGAIRGNSADEGAGVYVEEGGTLNMTGGAIGGTGYANEATNGAGVYSNGTVKLSGGYIRNNTATENGGGAYVAGGEFIVKGGYIGGTATTFANTAENGAGVYVNGGTFEMTDGTIGYNTGTWGGGVYSNYGKVIMTGGKISGNSVGANGGGGVYVNGGTFDMTGGTIGGTANDANIGASGAGVVIGASGVFTMNGGSITGNNGSAGGGLYLTSGTFILNDGTIANNTATGNGGGALITEYGLFEMNGGEISGNDSNKGGGMCVFGTAEINGGEISGNTAVNGGGVHVENGGELIINDGAISGNEAVNGGGIYNNGGTVQMNDGIISGNIAVYDGTQLSDNTKNGDGAGIMLANGGSFTMNGGVITANKADTLGGGVYSHTAANTVIITGGVISANTASYGGGVYVNDGTFEMSGGEITDNNATESGGGLRAYASTITLTGGKISNNTSAGFGGGVYLAGNEVVFNMTGGEISGNSTESDGGGVYIYTKSTMNLSGGKITGNRAAVNGGGIYVSNVEGATLNVSGSPIVSGNTANGAENNIYLAADQVITVTGMLAVNGMIAWLGVTMADPSKKKFTLGFAEKNTAYNPNLRPETVFFSDDTDYMVGLEDGEAVLKDNDYSQTSLIWQLSKDGGKTWVSIDAPYYSLRYKAGESYAIRALNSEFNTVAFTWATNGAGEAIDALNFKGIGSYKFVINSEEYINPSLTFEVLPATLYWQYSTDEGRTWFDLTVNTLIYTGATYNIRACVYDDGYVPVKVFTETMKDVGDYEFTVDEDLYENPVLNFSITTRYIDVEWNFGDALGNATDGYYWNYDGLVHAPVAVLGGVSNELAGVDLSYGYAWSGGSSYAAAQSYAGAYTLTVGLKTADKNIVLSNTSVQYKINGITLSLVWTDEDGNEGDEFTFEYDSEKHGVNFVLSGVITGDTVEPYVTYASRSGKELAEAPTAVGYYTATVKLPANCYNYVLDKTYTCQIVITQKTVAVDWIGNDDGTYAWTFNGQGKAPVASIINPITGEALNEAYTVEYAPVAENGNIGVYSKQQPVNAGKYIVRLTLTNNDGNFILDETTTTQRFTIEKLGVNITWTGGKNFNYDQDKDVYFWYYDGEEHSVEAKVELNGDVYKDGVIISSLDLVRTDAQTALTGVNSATAAVELANTAFNANFYIDGSASQVYEVRKAVITSVVWTDAFKNSYETGDTAEFDFGKVVGAEGPGFVAIANGTLELVVSYSKSYEGEWVVDEQIGYTAYARLSTADAANYEFADGAEYESLTFFIKSVGGFKTPIDVTWVVFINEYEYVALEQYLTDGGFVYNGNVQSPTPIYLRENGDYEILALNANSIGADAGKYTARIKPSSVYEIKEEDFACAYEIKKLDVVINWQDGQYDSNTTYSYVYSGKAQAPYAYATGEGEFDFTTVNVTVEGNVNAGDYLAKAIVGDNFNIVDGATQRYTVSKLGIDAGKIVWDFIGAGASGDADNGWYWVYDGKEHSPAAKITLDFITLELLVTGKTSEIGVHTAYAVLNSSLTAHNNFYLTGTASTTFEIVQVKIGQVYWEDDDGHVYEDGKGGNTGLVFTYNGDENGQAPKAYYLDENGDKVYLTVTVIGGTAINAGNYSAYVDIESVPSCTFSINAKELEAEWSNLNVTFNGSEQKPEVTLTGAELTEGEDYVVTGYVKAGVYKVTIKFINANYTVAEENASCEFVIEKITITENDFEWSDTGYDAEKDGYFWLFDGNPHAPTLTISYTIGEGGDAVEVTFEVGYTGVTSTVGTHTVTAYIKSAKIGELDVTDSFAFSADMEYVITAQTVTIDWDFGDAKHDEEKDIYFWTYDGSKHAPKAYLAYIDENDEVQRFKDEDGNDIELTVYGAETNARDKAYTATAELSEDYVLADGASATQQYYINKATIEVNWDFGELEADENGVYTWTYGDDITPKAYIRNENGENGAELTVTGFETDAGTHTLTLMQSDGNYEFANENDSAKTYVIKPMTVYVIWYGVGGYEENDTVNFEWDYVDYDTAIAPTAYLAYKDENGELQLLLDKDGNAIPVEVSGGLAEVGEHTAQAVDTFVNYDFAEEFTKNYKVLAKDLAESGFKWTDENAQVSEDGLTFTYEYSGGEIMPTPTSNVKDLEFNVTITNAAGEPVSVITEVGTYKVTVTCRDENYTVPEDMKTVTVIVTAKKVAVEWDETPLVYNGEKQQPKAYYTDVAGNKIELEVTVDGDSANAGTKYQATASLDTTNYELDEETKTYEFEIAQKEIEVKYTWEDVTYDRNKHAPKPEITVSASEKDGLTVVYEITKNGVKVAGDGEKVTEAGEYVIKVSLEGTAAGNYKLVNAEYEFNINKVALTVTAKDQTFDYGADAPEFTTDFATFEGLLADEADEVKAALADVISQWFRCAYVNTTVPGEYKIYIDAAWLNEYLNNYEVTGVNGKLTVNPAEGALVWVGDGESGADFTYNGNANLPEAYYYDSTGRKHELTVKLATYDEESGEYSVIDGEAVNAGSYFAVIVDANGNVIKADGNYTFENYGTAFKINKLEITVNVKDLQFTYGDVNLDELEAILGLGNGWTYGDNKPVDGDDLNIKLTIEGNYDDGNYLANGVYALNVGWNEEDFNDNYSLKVVNEGDGELVVEKAEIIVDYDEKDGYVYDAYGVLGSTDGYVSDFVTNTKDFLKLAGYQDAAVTAYFKLVDENDHAPDSDQYTGDIPEGLTEEGEYLFNFMIRVDNHETLYGRLLVKVSYAEYYLYVTVDGSKTLTETYGFETAEDFAKTLLESGYANYDEDLNRVISKETFLEWVTAKVIDENGNEVSGRLPVGNYKVIFALNENADQRYSIYKASTRTVAIEITKYVLDIDWGDESNLNYTYDGAAHMPVVKVEGITLDDGCKVSDGVYEITVNGEKVKVTVTVDGDFTAVGGHSLLVTVEGENFAISEENALRSVSINEPANEGEVPGTTVGASIEDWKLWLIIAAAIVLAAIIIALVIILVKRRKSSDDDGFYDDVAESDL